MTLRRNAPKANSGSPLPGEPEYLLVGKLRRPHGLHGDLLMEVLTDFPERLQPGIQVFVGAAYHGYVIADRRQHAAGLLVRFEGMATPEQAGVLRNHLVHVSGGNRPALPAGQYYHHELLGSEVIDEQGALLGQLNEILRTGANDVYVVLTHDWHELLLPAIDSVITRVDIARKAIHVRVPDGLVPERTTAGSRRSSSGKQRNASRG